MKTTLLFLLIFSCLRCEASEWSDADKIRESVVLTTLAIDYAQTRDIKNYNMAFEHNPLLGDHPSDSKIRNYFIASAIAHVLIADQLSPTYRKYLQNGTIALELVAIGKNKRMGLHLKF